MNWKSTEISSRDNWERREDVLEYPEDTIRYVIDLLQDSIDTSDEALIERAIQILTNPEDFDSLNDYASDEW
jgi:hypothetical protein